MWKEVLSKSIVFVSATAGSLLLLVVFAAKFNNIIGLLVWLICIISIMYDVTKY
jgi:hypothetical protein